MVSILFFIIGAAMYAFDGALCGTPPTLEFAVSAANGFWKVEAGRADTGLIALKPITQEATDKEGATLTMTFFSVGPRMKWSKPTGREEFCASQGGRIECKTETLGEGRGKYSVKGAKPKSALTPADNAVKAAINAVDVAFTRADTEPGHGHLLTYTVELASPEPKVGCKCSEARSSGLAAPLPLHATDALKETWEKLSLEMLCLAFCNAGSVWLKQAIRATYQ